MCAIRWPRQEDLKFENSLGYTARPGLKISKITVCTHNLLIAGREEQPEKGRNIKRDLDRMPDQWPSHLLPPPPLCSRGDLRTPKAKPSSHFTVSTLPSVPRSQAAQGWNRGPKKVKATVKQSGRDKKTGPRKHNSLKIPGV